MQIIYTGIYWPVTAVGSDRSETESEDGVVIRSSRPASCVNNQVRMDRCAWVDRFEYEQSVRVCAVDKNIAVWSVLLKLQIVIEVRLAMLGCWGQTSHDLLPRSCRAILTVCSETFTSPRLFCHLSTALLCCLLRSFTVAQVRMALCPPVVVFCLSRYRVTWWKFWCHTWASLMVRYCTMTQFRCCLSTTVFLIFQ